MRKNRKTSKDIRNIRCLIIAPMDAAGARVRNTIAQALRELSIDVISAERFPLGETLASSRIHTIASSDIIIVDLSRQNPNVMYELGFAHALRKATLVITSKDRKKPLPVNLAGRLFVVYDPDNLRTLKEQVTQFVSDYTFRILGKK